ncbi:hypothetical protein [Cellulophaga sp. Z1A5H]|uniref:hypothetical protein n=1 Tax=Cellulophaga sp. Z1A5H TaxID=2687291 RepID=UPI0013FD5475|nr:hypothetical protein [Cellulophaga sp. Z1A5H]
MEKPIIISENRSKLLTNERFEFGYLEVKESLKKLKKDGLIDEKQFEKIQTEDMLLKIKYKTYKKCVRNIIIGLVLTGIGCIGNSPAIYAVLLIGIIFSVSSFFGVLSNRITKNQKAYLK